MASTPPFSASPLPDNSDEQLIALTEHNKKPGRPRANLLTRFWRLLLLNPKMLTGCIIVGLFVLLAIFGPLIARYDPTALTLDILLPPSPDHWLGTTQSGQDVFAQLMIGTRSSILWGFIAGIIVTFIYIVVGLVAGYFGGLIDDILTFITNVFLVLPGFPLALLLAAYIPYKGPLTVAIVIALTGWPGHARVIRAQALSMRRRDFIEASQASGISTAKIIFEEMLPNMLAIIAAGFVSTMLSVVLAAAGLEFLGLGDIRSVSWGSMFYWAQNGQALVQGAWWWFVPPGVCVALLGAGLTFINIGIDEVADPRLRKQRKSRSDPQVPVMAVASEEKE
ncbi:hypothetical protein KDA_39840 [Dictyobacter alpinus]|uniref:ABC transmembrane type-1 domain-containing protein n=1 Tax=Dictyobacter alpinus TaxID=2014873 RepID=A0A402BB42_9CHLR|nr:ABC transporter permease [Dictyobacter alpinus]GCE28500.1 hypothetical protein KDA_39840 [Dictyobacter alpinus]